MLDEAIKAKLATLEAVTVNNSDNLEDYVANHILPIVIANSNGDILYCNQSMSDLIGHALDEVRGKNACSIYYHDEEEFKRVFDLINQNGYLHGLPIVLKTVDGLRTFKLYTNVRKDIKGNIVNTRCLFVPCD